MKLVLGIIAFMSGLMAVLGLIGIPLTIGFPEPEDIALPSHAFQWNDDVQLFIAALLIFATIYVASTHHRRLVISAALLVLLTCFDVWFAFNMAEMDDGRKRDWVLLQYLLIGVVAFIVMFSSWTAARRTIG